MDYKDYKSQKARESISKRWADKETKNESNTNVIRTYNDRNTIKEKKSKEKESKEKDIKTKGKGRFAPPSVLEIDFAF